MERIKIMKDHDKFTETEEELISRLHLNNRQCLNQLTKHLSTKSLIDYIFNDIIPETSDNITRNDEDEREEDDLGEKS
jgi:hypothetical protein